MMWLQLAKYWQLLLGAIGCAVLGVLLAIQTGKTHHWQKTAANEKLAYQLEKVAYEQTVLNYRAAAQAAKEADAKNAARVKVEQQMINKEVYDELQARLAGARAAVGRLQQAAKAGANPGSAATAPVPAIPTPTCGSDSPTLDPTTRAFGCAIQLDELIRWVKKQSAVNIQGNDNDTQPVERPVSGRK